jgi:hypothetical protein
MARRGLGRPRARIIRGAPLESNFTGVNVDFAPLVNFFQNRKREKELDEFLAKNAPDIDTSALDLSQKNAVVEKLTQQGLDQRQIAQQTQKFITGAVEQAAEPSKGGRTLDFIEAITGVPEQIEGASALGPSGQAAVTKSLGQLEPLKRQFGTPINLSELSDTRVYAQLINSDSEADQKLARDMLAFRRAQSPEVYSNRLAARNAEALTAQLIARNEELGKRLVQLETAAEIERQKVIGTGKITPEVKQQRAKDRFGKNLNKLAKHYVDLNSMGAIVNTENSPIDNLIASSGASPVGQFFGRVLGTKPQSIRASINKLRPLLLQDIRQSTDMGARGLDSEKELEFYMQAATDPTTDIQSNVAAIVVLDEAFGNGEVAQQLRNLTDEGLISRIADRGNQILNGATRLEPAGTNRVGRFTVQEIP